MKKIPTISDVISQEERDLGKFQLRKVLPPNGGWLEAKLTNKHMDFLWKCIDKRHKEVHKDLAGNLHGSYSLQDKHNNLIFYEQVIQPLMVNWVDIYGDIVFRNTRMLGKMIPVLNDWWVNYQREGDFNPMHDHGGLFSFVIWMKIPTHWKEQKKLPRCAASNSNCVSNFQFLYTDYLGKILTSTYYMTPELEGTMLFFPAELKHQVYPFYDCKEERISIAGNVSSCPVPPNEKNSSRISINTIGSLYNV
jgi:hypothetical protein|tara:strand:- start:332 stop:1081 length:750 start_codon:yes stop_codon:yes gene_type:complete